MYLFLFQNIMHKVHIFTNKQGFTEINSSHLLKHRGIEAKPNFQRQLINESVNREETFDVNDCQYIFERNSKTETIPSNFLSTI